MMYMSISLINPINHHIGKYSYFKNNNNNITIFILSSNLFYIQNQKPKFLDGSTFMKFYMFNTIPNQKDITEEVHKMLIFDGCTLEFILKQWDFRMLLLLKHD